MQAVAWGEEKAFLDIIIIIIIIIVSE